MGQEKKAYRPYTHGGRWCEDHEILTSEMETHWTPQKKRGWNQTRKPTFAVIDRLAATHKRFYERKRRG